MTRPASDQLVFDVLAEIAAGTTARIDLCRIREPVDRAGRLVAVKRLHKHIADDREFADMFFDEVWMTASLRHKNVVRVEGWGNDGDGTYLAVELVEGVSLARLMKTVFETGEMFSERMVVYLGSEMCAGLSAAHQLVGQDGEHLHLVHRDLTPGNVLIGFAGQIKITDFGLAKAKQRVTKTLTGLLKGHPQYMAPEMARGLEIDSRSDLFSLGVVLFELFAGQHPWAGASELEIMRVTAVDPPKDLLSLRPKLDRELATVVHKLLQKDPNERFQTAEEVRARLMNWLDTHGYIEGNEEALGRFVRRNAMRQQRWFERAVGGELTPFPASLRPGAIPSKRPRPDSVLSGPAIPRPAAVPTAMAPGRAAAPDPRATPAASARTAPRHRRRRLREDESTDISNNPQDERSVALSNAPESSGDWGEEIPTVVKKKTDPIPLPPVVRPPPAPLPRGMASPTAETVREREAPIPQFALQEDDSDSHDTSVTAKDRGLGIVDPLSEDAPTVPAPKDARAHRPASDVPAAPARPPRAPLPPIGAKSGIPALPPPPVPSAETLPRPHSASAPPSDVRAQIVPPLRSGDHLLDEADRLAVEAVRLRDDAALFAALAELAHDAAALAAEAVRARAQGSPEKAELLLQDAYHLEDSLRRQEAQIERRGPSPSIEPPRPRVEEADVVAGKANPRPRLSWEGQVPAAPAVPQPVSYPPQAPVEPRPAPPPVHRSAPPSAEPKHPFGLDARVAAEHRPSSRPIRRPPPRLLDQTLLGMRISTAIALVAAFVFAVILLIAFATC
ncbi:MAG: protein kinase [Polyangiaceae bacterium]